MLACRYFCRSHRFTEGARKGSRVDGMRASSEACRRHRHGAASGRKACQRHLVSWLLQGRGCSVRSAGCGVRGGHDVLPQRGRPWHASSSRQSGSRCGVWPNWFIRSCQPCGQGVMSGALTLPGARAGNRHAPDPHERPIGRTVPDPEHPPGPPLPRFRTGPVVVQAPLSRGLRSRHDHPLPRPQIGAAASGAAGCGRARA